MESLFNKVKGLKAFIKRDSPTQVFSCENSEIFQNSFLYRASLVAASDVSRLNPLDYLTYSWLCLLSQIT